MTFRLVLEGGWRGDPAQILPFREWMRLNFPQARGGVVLEDLDLVVRRFDTSNETDWRMRLVEAKHNPNWAKAPHREMPWGQRFTFGPLDYAMTTALPDYYDGFWVMAYGADTVWEVGGDVALERWRYGSNKFCLVRDTSTRAVVDVDSLGDVWGLR
jgi:hypothetical protein